MNRQVTNIAYGLRKLSIFHAGLLALNVISLLLLVIVFESSYTASLQALIFFAVTLFLLQILLTFGLLQRVSSKMASTRSKLIQLEEANTRLVESNQFKERIFLVINHELRTPLSSAKGYLELLQTYEDTLSKDEKNQYFSQINKACEEVTLLVNSMADNIVSSSPHEIALEPIALLEIVNVVHDSLALRIHNEQREVQIAIEPALSVFAEPLRLRQVLANLLANAMNYSAPGTPIQISANLNAPPSLQQQTWEPTNAMAYLAIKDAGIGITKADQKRLFQPFTRLEQAKVLSSKGSGLGLYVCKQMLEVMQGHIWIESDGIDTHGTTLWACLQLAP